MNTKLFAKAAIVGAIVIALTIPLMLIRGVIAERGAYRDRVAADIARTWTGPQTVLGPIVSIPYEIQETERLFNHETRKYETETKTLSRQFHMMADTVTIDAAVDLERRWRGIYSVPVYRSTLTIEGTIDATVLARKQNTIEGFSRWLPATFSVVIDDMRGIAGEPTLSFDGAELELVPQTRLSALPDGLHAALPVLPVEGRIAFSLELDVRGSQSLSLSALADTATATMGSAWPHPKFDGRFLPTHHDVTDSGFEAEWHVSAYGTGVDAALDACVRLAKCHALLDPQFGVAFIETTDIYSKVTRATKYGLLFIVLTFAAFALIETLSRARVHPVQYALVGVALAIFFLLLISLSEHMHFAKAYALATGACVGLIGVYLSGALGSARRGAAFGAGIATLYAMLYAILRSEDFALLMGTLLLFAMLAAVMLLTRRVNWYRFGASAEET